jgi:NTP pyrophosphatase (non-canonical NTP hydrolase)
MTQIPVIYTKDNADGFVESVEKLQTALHANAVNHGWWDEPEYKAELKAALNEFDAHSNMSGAQLVTLRELIDKIPDYNPGEKIALMHSELSESLEGIRGNNESSKTPGFTGEEEELADVIIRILDYAGKRKLRIAEAVLAKAHYNMSRPYRHGGKKF